MAENLGSGLFSLPPHPEQYSPLTLAYIGDSVLDILVKSYFVSLSNKQVQKYHREVSGVVSAVNQSAFIDGYEEKLSEEEQKVYRRGRNATVHTKAKNATMAEYKKATGLEAVLGFLYLKEEYGRVSELVKELLHFSGYGE